MQEKKKRAHEKLESLLREDIESGFTEMTRIGKIPVEDSVNGINYEKNLPEFQRCEWLVMTWGVSLTAGYLYINPEKNGYNEYLTPTCLSTQNIFD